MGFFDIFRVSQIKKENEALRNDLLHAKQQNEELHASNEELIRRANESGITEY